MSIKFCFLRFKSQKNANELISCNAILRVLYKFYRIIIIAIFYERNQTKMYTVYFVQLEKAFVLVVLLVIIFVNSLITCF